MTHCVQYSQIADFCHTLFRFPRGTIIAMGIRTSNVFQRFAVVGGTDYYSNVGGQVTTVSLSRLRARVVFNLEGF